MAAPSTISQDQHLREHDRHRHSSPSSDDLINAYPFHTLPGGGTVLVLGPEEEEEKEEDDVYISLALSSTFPHLDFVFQDGGLLGSLSPEREEEGIMESGGRQEEKKKGKWRYFKPQTMRNPAAILIRQCLHIMDDETAVGILSNLVPGMENEKRGAGGEEVKLLIYDTMLPSGGGWESMWEDKKKEEVTQGREGEATRREVNLFAQEGIIESGVGYRTVEELKELLRRADERFEVVNVFGGGGGEGKGGGLGMIEVRLRR